MPTYDRNKKRQYAIYGHQEFWGIWGEWLFIFRELGSTGNYFRGGREKAHNYGELGSPAKKQKKKEKASILFDFLKFSSIPRPPLSILKVFVFVLTGSSRFIEKRNMAILGGVDLLSFNC